MMINCNCVLCVYLLPYNDNDVKRGGVGGLDTKEFGCPGRARPAPPAGQCVPPNPHYQRQKVPRIKIFLANGDLGGVCVREIHTIRPNSSTGERPAVGRVQYGGWVNSPKQVWVKACAQIENHGNSGQLLRRKRLHGEHYAKQ